MNHLKYNYTDNGFCRVNYTWKNSKNQTVHYCAQDEGDQGVIFYRCTGDPWNEPEYSVKPLEAPPLSPGSEDTDKVINNWIKEKWGINK